MGGKIISQNNSTRNPDSVNPDIVNVDSANGDPINTVSVNAEIANADYVNEMNDKLDKIFSKIRDKKVIIAFTGGLGSFVLLKLAQRVCSEIQCVFIDTNYISSNDRKSVEQYMQSDEIGSDIHIIVRPDLNKDILILNSADREFFCKKSIVELLDGFRKKINFDFVLDGTTLENYMLFWKGRNPFNASETYYMIYGDLKITRKDLILIAEKNGLLIKRYPETSLLSRFAYNIPLTSDLMNFIVQSENYITEISKFPIIRLRIIDMNHVIIETEKKYISTLMSEEIRAQIFSKISEFGFKSISIDLAGYRCNNLYLDKN